MDDVELTALHEAAHVVLAMYHGIPLAYAEVHGDRGRVELDEHPLTNHQDNYQNYVQFYLAGIAYEERLGPIHKFDYLRADYAMAEEELYWWGSAEKDKEIAYAKERCRKALKECRVRHHLIAAELILNGRIEKDRLLEIWLK